MTMCWAKPACPVYDLVTTSVYLPKDSMALTLNGTTRWPSAKELQRLGETRMGGTPFRVKQILERIDGSDLRHFNQSPRLHQGTRGICGNRGTDASGMGERLGSLAEN